MQTPEEKAASDNLHEAIAGSLRAEGMQDDNVPGDWVVIASSVSFDGDGDAMASYFLLYRGGTLMNHVARGLLESGLELFRSGLGYRSDDGAEG